VNIYTQTHLLQANDIMLTWKYIIFHDI